MIVFCSREWVIVEFLGTNPPETEIVPSNWLTTSKKYSYWPDDVTSASRISKLVQKCSFLDDDPNLKYSKHKVSVKCMPSKYSYCMIMYGINTNINVYSIVFSTKVYCFSPFVLYDQQIGFNIETDWSVINHKFKLLLNQTGDESVNTDYDQQTGRSKRRIGSVVLLLHCYLHAIMIKRLYSWVECTTLYSVVDLIIYIAILIYRKKSRSVGDEMLYGGYSSGASCDDINTEEVVPPTPKQKKTSKKRRNVDESTVVSCTLVSAVPPPESLNAMTKKSNLAQDVTASTSTPIGSPVGCIDIGSQRSLSQMSSVSEHGGSLTADSEHVGLENSIHSCSSIRESGGL